MEITDRILSEASQLFIKNGIRSVTMDDIAREMGISKRTIYENFRDKDELLKSCICVNKEQQRQQKIDMVQSSANALEAIFGIMYEVINSMNQIHPSFITDLRKYHYTVWKEFFQKHQEEHLSDLRNLITKGIVDGLFRNDIHVEIVTRILNIQLNEISNDEVFPSEEFTRAEVFVNIIVNFTRGIATTKGIRTIEKMIEKRRNINQNK